MNKQNSFLIQGTNGFDFLTTDSSQLIQVIFGLGGTDILQSRGGLDINLASTKTLVGGSGNTIYEIANNSGAMILESQNIFDSDNNDYDILSTTNFGTGIDLDGELTSIFEFENRHLSIIDESSRQSIFLFDWQNPKNRIEEFYFKDENLTYTEFANSFRSLDSYEGNTTYLEAGVNPIEFESNFQGIIDESDLRELSNPIEKEDSILELYRFRNSSFNTGTYLFVAKDERDGILTNHNLNQVFQLEGEGNIAFKASAVSRDDLEAFYRLRNKDISGTYTFVGQAEYDAIFAHNSPFKDNWIKEGFNSQGVDIPDFYLFGAGTDRGKKFYRLRNNQNNTFLFASSDEVTAIENDPLLSASFTNQGLAFESF